eukprot:COSAG01_NODE_18868_length_1047_cov_3.508439_1_plen_65_part_01
MRVCVCACVRACVRVYVCVKSALSVLHQYEFLAADVGRLLVRAPPPTSSCNRASADADARSHCRR